MSFEAGSFDGGLLGGYIKSSSFNPYGKAFLEKNLEPFGVKLADVSGKSDADLYNSAAKIVLAKFQELKDADAAEATPPEESDPPPAAEPPPVTPPPAPAPVVKPVAYSPPVIKPAPYVAPKPPAPTPTTVKIAPKLLPKDYTDPNANITVEQTVKKGPGLFAL